MTTSETTDTAAERTGFARRVVGRGVARPPAVAAGEATSAPAGARVPPRVSETRGGAGWRSGWPALIVTSLCRAALSVIAGLLIWSVLPAAFGWHTTVVMSGSMAPKLPIGAVVVERPVAANRLRAGQILLVEDPDHLGGLRLHRLVTVNANGMLRLRGDANSHADRTLVAPKAVLGVGALCIPAIGLPVYWWHIGNAGALVATILAVAFLLAGAFAYRFPTSDGSEVGRPRDDENGAGPYDEGDGDVPDPNGSGRPNPRKRGLRQVATPIVVVGVLLLILGSAPQALAGVWAQSTSDNANSWAATSYFSCKDAVAADSPTVFYRLSDSSGSSSVTDSSGNGYTGTYYGGVTSGVAGACPRDADPAITLDGTSGYLSSNAAFSNPTVFTLELWFKTATANGGDLISFGSARTGLSPLSDRKLYMTNSGELGFSIDNGTYVLTSSRAYNDGNWHLADASLSAAGMVLYVDGNVAASKTNATTPVNMSGYWRVGFGDLSDEGVGNAPSSFYFAGTVDEVAVYPIALSAAHIAAHYYAS